MGRGEGLIVAAREFFVRRIGDQPDTPIGAELIAHHVGAAVERPIVHDDHFGRDAFERLKRRSQTVAEEVARVPGDHQDGEGDGAHGTPDRLRVRRRRTL